MTLSLQNIMGRCARRGECRVWPGCCNNSGMPQASDGAKRRGIHLRREVYRLAVGPIPDKHEVIMTCEVAACLQPKHMLAVTKAERMARLARAGRISTPRFVAARTKVAREQSDFTFEKAQALRQRAKDRKRGDMKRLAAEFGISPSMASRIVRGQSWKDLQPAAPEVKVQRLPGCSIRSKFEPPQWFRGELSREWDAMRAANSEVQEAA